MAVLTLSQVIGGSPILLAPTILTDRKMQSASGTYIVADLVAHGLSVTAETASATLTEVLNITGAGVIQFLAIGAGTSDTASPIKWRIVIDGVTVLDRTTGSVADTDIFAAVGGLRSEGSSGTGGVLIFFEAIPFYESLVVSQAGDGVDQVQTIYSRYLT